MFLIYVNDICNVSALANLILFADDTNLLFSHKDLTSLTEMVNQEINKFSSWLIANKLSLNLDKTKFMVFSPRQRKIPAEISIAINGKEIEKVKQTIFLGVVIDEHLSWKHHIAHVANKISKSIGIIENQAFSYSNHHYERCISLWFILICSTVI